MTIGQNTTISVQTSKKVTINDVGAVKIVDADARRTSLRVELPLNLSIMSAVVSESESQANALLGEPMGQNFLGNANRYRVEVDFDTNTSAQGEKWAFVDSSIGTSLTTFDIFVIEYIG